MFTILQDGARGAPNACMVSILNILEKDAMGAHSLDVNYSKGRCNGGPMVSIFTIVEDDSIGAPWS